MTKQLTALTLLIGFAATSLAAQDAKTCDDDTLSMVIEEVEDAPLANKEAAMLELQMAKDKMAEGDAAACGVHLTNASNAARGT